MGTDISTLPQQVRNFIAEVHINAKRVEEWDEDFIQSLLYVQVDKDGGVTISDNYERFFGTVYTYTYGGKWLVRSMYGEGGDREYSYDKVMADASIMYTG
jgi:hypothetical protein